MLVPFLFYASAPVEGQLGAEPHRREVSPIRMHRAAFHYSAAIEIVDVIDDDTSSDSRIRARRSRRWKLPPYDDPRADSAIRAFVRGDVCEKEAADLSETLDVSASGLVADRAWDQAFLNEQDRFRRYGRPVTLLVAELEGLDSLAAILGQDAADRLIVPVEAALRRDARRADSIARIGPVRFAALLPETDESAAGRYAERVCRACNAWLEAGGVGVRLAIGWAQAIPGGRLADALRLAADRMNADSRRQGFDVPPANASAAQLRRGLSSPGRLTKTIE